MEFNKASETQEFSGRAKVAKKENANLMNDSDFFTFKKWEKHGKHRIYVNDYKGRTIGYIENATFTLIDSMGNYQSEIDYALKQFYASYVF